MHHVQPGPLVTIAIMSWIYSGCSCLLFRGLLSLNSNLRGLSAIIWSRCFFEPGVLKSFFGGNARLGVVNKDLS